MQKIARRFTCALLVCCMILTSFAFQLTSVAHGATFTPRYDQPDYNSGYYGKSAGNPFSLNPTTGGNCTYYAWGRAYEIMGEPLPAVPNSEGNPNHFATFRSNAMYFWYDNLYLSSIGEGFAYGSTPKLGAIAVWDGASWNGDCGHVAIVEEVNGNTFVTSNSSWSYESFYTSTESTSDPDLLGFIYLIDDTTDDSNNDSTTDEPDSTPEAPDNTPDETTPEEPTTEPDTPTTPDTTTPEEPDTSTPEDTETPDTTPDVDPDDSVTAPETDPDDDTATPVTEVTAENTETTVSVDTLPEGATLSAKAANNKAEIASLAQANYGETAEIVEAINVSFYADTQTLSETNTTTPLTMTFGLGDRFKDNGELKVVQYADGALTEYTATVDAATKSVAFSTTDTNALYAVVFIPDQVEDPDTGNTTAEPAAVELSKSNLTIFTGNTIQLTAAVTDANGSTLAANVTWTSSDTAVASVDAEGNITANAVGTATITAQTDNGITATCAVTVQEKPQDDAQQTPSNDSGNTNGTSDSQNTADTQNTAASGSQSTTAETSAQSAKSTSANPNTGISQEALMTGEVPAWMIPAIIAMLGAGLAIIGTYGYIHHKRNKRRI